MNLNAAVFLAAALVALLAWQGVRQVLRRQQALRQIKEGWGRPKTAACRPHEIPLYHHLLSRRGSFDAQERDTIDDRTWSDLHLEAIFGQVDHAQSTVGKQFLYRLLRTPSCSAEDLAARDRQANCFAADASLRASLQGMLQALNSRDAAFLPYLFLQELPPRPRAFWVFPLLSLSALGCMLGAFLHPLLLLGLAPLALANIIIAPAYRQQIVQYIAPLRVLGALLGTAQRMQALAETQGSAILSECLAPYRAARPFLQGLARITPLLVFEQTTSDEVFKLLYAYVNMLLLTDVIIFVFCLDTLRRNQLSIQSVYEAVGGIDAMISLASFRHSLLAFARPQFTPPAKSLHIEGATHPLLDAPVPNSLRVLDAGVFLTGSNMSGKTTFMRTVGVNAIMAQTLFTCLATCYEGPLLRVRTCIGRNDSLYEGKSYYLAEVERIGDFLLSAAAGPPCLFIMDEIYRGTNTTERMAAAKAVLDALNSADAPHVVLVSTHDLEIAGLLTTPWLLFHFREFVQDATLVFDYRLRPGLSSTCNALRLLEEAGYPASVVADALTTACNLREGRAMLPGVAQAEASSKKP